MVVKAFFQTFHFQYVISADDPWSQMDMDLRIDFCRLFQNLDLVQHFLTAFRTADRLFTVEGFQLGDHFLLVFDLTLLV